MDHHKGCKLPERTMSWGHDESWTHKRQPKYWYLSIQMKSFAILVIFLFISCSYGQETSPSQNKSSPTAEESDYYYTIIRGDDEYDYDFFDLDDDDDWNDVQFSDEMETAEDVQNDDSRVKRIQLKRGEEVTGSRNRTTPKRRKSNKRRSGSRKNSTRPSKRRGGHKGHKRIKPIDPCEPEKVGSCLSLNGTEFLSFCDSGKNYCVDDCDCPGYQKCCYNSCGRTECLPSINTPSPPTTVESTPGPSVTSQPETSATSTTDSNVIERVEDWPAVSNQ